MRSSREPASGSSSTRCRASARQREQPRQVHPGRCPDTTTYPGSDYYVIALKRYTQKTARTCRRRSCDGYVQLNNGHGRQRQQHRSRRRASPTTSGPMIIAQRNRPVRVKFINKLPTGSGGNLFLPVDTDHRGRGHRPATAAAPNYTQNRATLHLHGGFTRGSATARPTSGSRRPARTPRTRRASASRTCPTCPIPARAP